MVGPRAHDSDPAPDGALAPSFVSTSALAARDTVASSTGRASQKGRAHPPPATARRLDSPRHWRPLPAPWPSRCEVAWTRVFTLTPRVCFHSHSHGRSGRRSRGRRRRFRAREDGGGEPRTSRVVFSRPSPPRGSSVFQRKLWIWCFSIKTNK